MRANALFEDNLSDADVEHLATVIGILARNFAELGGPRRLTTLNLVLKLAITRDARELVIPPMNDLAPKIQRRRPPGSRS